jgi:predicted dehydrogenase
MKVDRAERPPGTRRAFLGRSLAIGGALAVPWAVPARVLGLGGAVAPSAKITLGVIGVGPRCKHVLGCMLEEADVQCLAICDIQAGRRDAGKSMVDRKYGNNDCATHQDFRELLARPDIDTVLVATSDRWHATASAMAARAGKDVYSEKPCAMTIDEGRRLAAVMRRTGRVFQAGTQRRSISNYELAVQVARGGKLGKVHTLHASIYRPAVRYDWLPAEPEPPKDVVDWDLWLGPAPWRPYNKAYVGGGWRGFWDFEAGCNLLDWGAHTVDLCQWANGTDDTVPVEYEPTKENIVARYANGVRLVLDFLATPFGNRDPHYHTALGTCPVRFVGEEGWIETADSGDLLAHPASLQAEVSRLRSARRTAGTNAANHGRNFFDCVRTRGRTAANPEVMRRSHAACHAAALAWLLNRKLTLDPEQETFVGDGEANRLRSRALREPWSL